MFFLPGYTKEPLHLPGNIDFGISLHTGLRLVSLLNRYLELRVLLVSFLHLFMNNNSFQIASGTRERRHIFGKI